MSENGEFPSAAVQFAPKKRKNSRAKGKGGELEWAHWLQARGIKSARRSAQFCGKHGDADVVTDGELSHFHQEVKRVEQLNIHDAVIQAQRDSGGKKIPIVAHRRNSKEWLVTMPAEAWLALAKSFEERILETEELYIEVTGSAVVTERVDDTHQERTRLG